MCIAKQVLDDYKAERRLAIPDGQKAVAYCYGLSSEDTDKRRCLELVFVDGSSLSIDTQGGCLELYLGAEAGEATYSL